MDDFYERLTRLAGTGRTPIPLRQLASVVHRLALQGLTPVPGDVTEFAPMGEPVRPVPTNGGNGQRRRNGRSDTADPARAAMAADPADAGGAADPDGPARAAAPARARTGGAGRPEQREIEALLEHLGHLAVEARRGTEADALVGAMVPLAIRSLPGRPPLTLLTAVPRLIRSTSAMMRGLAADPAIRPLVRLTPAILTGALARHAAAAGEDRPDIVRVLADEGRRVIADPAVCVELYARSRSADERFHGAAVRGPQ